MLKLGVVGIGGYASYVARGVFDAAKAGGAVRFVAACDPLADQQPSHRDALLQAGVPVLGDFGSGAMPHLNFRSLLYGPTFHEPVVIW